MVLEIEGNALRTGEVEGIEWATKTAPLYGAVNGYVHLPEGHPWRGLDLMYEHYELVDVHGGVTYGPDANGWIGFDTLHAFDVWPGELEFWRKRGKPELAPTRSEGIEWTPEMVVEETIKLARQVAAASTAVTR